MDDIVRRLVRRKRHSFPPASVSMPFGCAIYLQSTIAVSGHQKFRKPVEPWP